MLIRLAHIDKYPEIPYKPGTLYSWVHYKKNPELFVKIGKSVFIDTEKFSQLVEKSRVASNGEE